MGLKDKLRRLTDEAKEYASSAEAQARLDSVKLRATELAESDVARRTIAIGREVGGEVLTNLTDGDTPTQAAARVAKVRLIPTAAQ